jgi:uncharacterized protein YndB with AHSA1/START domain
MSVFSSIESPLAERELVLVRESDVPAARFFAAWTSAETYPIWFCPKPWYVSDVKLDVRPGGSSSMFICGPNGEKFPNGGLYLEIVPNEKIVFTDAFTGDWEPNPNFMFTGILTFETLPNGRTRYTARARHWTKEGSEKHASMGFHDGWGKVFEQLEAFCQSA